MLFETWATMDSGGYEFEMREIMYVTLSFIGMLCLATIVYYCVSFRDKVLLL